MMNESSAALIIRAKAVLRQGDRTLARRLAQKAVALDRENVEGWLLLAGLSHPVAGLSYAEKALNLAPNDPVVIQAYEWASSRLPIETPIDQEQTQAIYYPVPSKNQLPPMPVVETHKPVWLWTNKDFFRPQNDHRYKSGFLKGINASITACSYNVVRVTTSPVNKPTAPDSCFEFVFPKTMSSASPSSSPDSTRS